MLATTVGIDGPVQRDVGRLVVIDQAFCRRVEVACFKGFRLVFATIMLKFNLLQLIAARPGC